MRQRTKSRELALQLLYQLDVRKESSDEIIESFWQYQLGIEPNMPDTVKEFAGKIITGVVSRQKELDSVIKSYA